MALPHSTYAGDIHCVTTWSKFDVVFAGVFAFLTIWLTHGLLYRWRRTRITDEAVARMVDVAAKPVTDRRAVARALAASMISGSTPRSKRESPR